MRSITTLLLVCTVLSVYAAMYFMSLAQDSRAKLEAALITPTAYVTPEINEQTLFDLVERFRASQNLTPYTKSDTLCQIATERLGEIQTNFSHAGFQAQWEKHTELFAMGENLSRGFQNEEQVLDAWLASASHSANLKRNYTSSCLECENNYCVHIMGTFLQALRP